MARIDSSLPAQLPAEFTPQTSTGDNADTRRNFVTTEC